MRDYDRWDGSEQTFLDTDDFSIVCIPNYIHFISKIFISITRPFTLAILKMVRVGNTE